MIALPLVLLVSVSFSASFLRASECYASREFEAKTSTPSEVRQQLFGIALRPEAISLLVIYLSLLTGLAAILWWAARNYSLQIGRYFLKRLRDGALNDPGSLFAVFSVETADGKEAEFINDSVSQKKVARFLRFFLLVSYLLFAALIVFNEWSWPG